jgi:drug/metabolite transporter (DMT)-like permease
MNLKRTLPRRLAVVAALGTVYVVWGSTYLAIRYALETVPPFLMMAVRCGVAGVLLFAWGRLRGVGAPTAREWRGAAGAGALLFLGGHGALSWAEQTVSSGVASVVFATIPLWMTLLQASMDRAHRVGVRTVLGVLGGAGGVIVLVGPWRALGGDPVSRIGVAALLFSALSWSLGSALTRSLPPARSAALAMGAQFICGAMMLLVASAVAGELRGLESVEVSKRSVLALVYLVAFGSILGFGAYSWLLRNLSLSRVSTYAYVNPVVAVALGWVLGGEVVNARVGAAATLVVVSVIVILARRPARPAHTVRTTQEPLMTPHEGRAASEVSPCWK